MEKPPESKLKDMKICDFNDREFKFAVLKKLNKMQENTGSLCNGLRNQINEQNKYFNKEIEI